MRLTDRECDTICRLVHEAYGPRARVWLFGSQLDDTRKGGDIDLLVEIPADAPQELWPELCLHAALEEALEARKVDLLVERAGEPERPFVRIAEREGELLAPENAARRGGETESSAEWRSASMSEAETLLLEIPRTSIRTGDPLRRLKASLARCFPVRPETLAAMDEDSTYLTDALLKRFEQHAHAMGACAVTIVRLSGEQDRFRTRRQVFDRLEGLGVVPSAKRLIGLIELRNRTVHAYAPDSARQALILNSVYEAIPELLDLAARFARYARSERILPEAKAGVVSAALDALAAANRARALGPSDGAGRRRGTIILRARVRRSARRSYARADGNRRNRPRPRPGARRSHHPPASTRTWACAPLAPSP